MPGSELLPNRMVLVLVTVARAAGAARAALLVVDDGTVLFAAPAAVTFAVDADRSPRSVVPVTLTCCVVGEP